MRRAVLVAAVVLGAGCGGREVTVEDVTPCLNRLGVVVSFTAKRTKGTPPPRIARIAMPRVILAAPAPQWRAEIALNGHRGATNLHLARAKSDADARKLARTPDFDEVAFTVSGPVVRRFRVHERYGRYALSWNGHPTAAQHRRVLACL
ncbi:MAG TPA: hypothetical protein VGJ77_13510 [Gaiellaceae bacterium]